MKGAQITKTEGAQSKADDLMHEQRWIRKEENDVVISTGFIPLLLSFRGLMIEAVLHAAQFIYLPLNIAPDLQFRGVRR